MPPALWARAETAAAIKFNLASISFAHVRCSQENEERRRDVCHVLDWQSAPLFQKLASRTSYEHHK